MDYAYLYDAMEILQKLLILNEKREIFKSFFEGKMKRKRGKREENRKKFSTFLVYKTHVEVECSASDRTSVICERSIDESWKWKMENDQARKSTRAISQAIRIYCLFGLLLSVTINHGGYLKSV